MVDWALPGARILEVHRLEDGIRNSNLKLYLHGAAEPFVLRIYEHHASLCQKELDLSSLLAKSVPQPEIVAAAPSGYEELPPFLLKRFVEGITFRELRRCGDRDAISQAAYAAGTILAAIHQVRFPRPGWLAPGLEIGSPLAEGPDPVPHFIDSCLSAEALRRRVPHDLRSRIHRMVWDSAGPLRIAAQESYLVHGDFNKRNLIVRGQEGGWRVAAVLDWEYAVSGSRFADVANFLRSESESRPLAEPYFSTGYVQAGGTLPENWLFLCRLVDLTAICGALTVEQLPPDAASELVEFITATAAR